MPGTAAALSAWAFLVWVLLTWTLTAEQLAVGAGVSIAVGLVLAPLGRASGPWRLLRPSHLVAAARLAIVTTARIVAANVKLSARIWAPGRPLSSGMIIVDTEQRSEGGLGAVGLISSLVVENQIVDIDRRSHRLQYHAIDVPDGGGRAARDSVNGPVEHLLEPLLEPPPAEEPHPEQPPEDARD